MILFLNGAFIAEEQAGIDPADRGFTLADGVFDTLLAVNGALHFADAHFARLHRHAALLGIAPPRTADALPADGMALLRKNSFLQGRYALRTTVTRGPGARGLSPPGHPTPTLLMRATPSPAAPEKDVWLIIATVTRRNEHSPLSNIKSLNYGDSLLALLEARERGADDAIVLNTAGNVACATTSNVFIRERGDMLTPPLADGALDGIVRATLLSEGGREASISPDRLRAADQIILTNSIAGRRRGILL